MGKIFSSHSTKNCRVILRSDFDYFPHLHKGKVAIFSSLNYMSCEGLSHILKDIAWFFVYCCISARCGAVDTASFWAWCTFGQWSYKEVHFKQLGSHGNSLFKVFTWTTPSKAGLSCSVQEISWRGCCISHIWRLPQGTTFKLQSH